VQAISYDLNQNKNIADVKYVSYIPKSIWKDTNEGRLSFLQKNSEQVRQFQLMFDLMFD
jgi:hypothetical protein